MFKRKFDGHMFTFMSIESLWLFQKCYFLYYDAYMYNSFNLFPSHVWLPNTHGIFNLKESWFYSLPLICIFIKSLKMYECYYFDIHLSSLKI